MKIYIGGIYQEANTFCPHLTDLSFFQRGYYLKGPPIREVLRGTNTEVGGFCQILESHSDMEIADGMAAFAVPYGRLSSQTFTILAEDIEKTLKSRLPVDGVLLTLHGSLVSEEEDDCDGTILERVRSVVGPHVPVVCTLDYHAAITEKMRQNADLLVGYRTYPHVDYAQAGVRAARNLLRLIPDKSRPYPVFKRLPMIVPPENAETEKGPMAEGMARLQILDRDEKVISASLFCSQPWLDVPDNNLSLIIYTKERDTGYYSEYAQRILDSIWEKRQEFLVDFPDIKTVLANIGQYPKPVILIDSGDITTAGCPGDSTEILRALLDFSSPWKTIIPLVDPETVQRAVAVGKGNEGEFFPGGSPNGGYNLRTPVKARVLSLSDTPIRIKGQSLAGLKLDMGCRVCLKMNEAIHLIVTEYSSWAHDPEFIRSMLLKPEDFDILVQKSHKLFRAAYANIARSVIAVGTSGCSSPRLDQFVFTKVKRPVFPLDPFEE